jgi:hypothetical protein
MLKERVMRSILLAGISAALLLATPAMALTAKEKMDTCKFGAADQKLTGKKEQDFIKKCMANEPAAPAGQAQKK